MSSLALFSFPPAFRPPAGFCRPPVRNSGVLNMKAHEYTRTQIGRQGHFLEMEDERQPQFSYNGRQHQCIF